MGHINVGVDTNILYHFGNVERLKWEQLFPDVSSVTVFVCAQVQKEMDNHKDTATGYVRNRAREYQTLLRSAELDAGYRHRSMSGAIAVEFAFLDRPRDTDLDPEAFDLAEEDSRIVAELLHAAASYGVELTLLANDARPIRVARQHGMKTLRPDAWEQQRAEPETPEVTRLRAEVRELRQRLGAHPDTRLSGLPQTSVHRIFAGFDSGFDAESFLERLKAGLIECHGLPSAESVAREHNVRRDPFHLASGLGRVTSFDIDRYHDELGQFDQDVREFDIEAFKGLLRNLSMVASVKFELLNEGTRPDESVTIDVALVSAGRFVNPDDFHDEFGRVLELPSPPAPFDPLIMTMSEHLQEQHARDHEFVEIARDESGRTRRYLCKKFQHGTTEVFAEPFVRSQPDQQSVVELTLRSGHLSNAVVRRITILHEHADFSEREVVELLKDPIGLLEPELRRALGRAVATLSH
ncbi:hypothetical protein [Mesorhizobium sp.]|uniref:hypothetical protein n=1 Tax=Mesorhizobium sp. TaxID=1871066 RepID=UPI0011F5B354|nr:hypothetical protein [Mesorhizobium sp.]TIS87703.1 MAG: hypothetical protein E5W89_24020 [Mesorhizobium sp.]